MSALMMSGTADAMKMSSRDISDLTGKRHDHVMRDIRAVLIELHGEEGLPSFGASYLNEQNKSQPCFCLPKRETLILVSGYSLQLRTKIIDRWQELEAENAKPSLNPANFSRLQLIQMAMQAEQERLLLEHQVTEMTPKVIALDRIASADGAICVTSAAKHLQVRPKQLFLWLQANEWIYRRAGGSSWLAYQPKLQQGVLSHKVTTVSRSDGTEKIVEQLLVTPKGLAKIANDFRRYAA